MLFMLFDTSCSLLFSRKVCLAIYSALMPPDFYWERARKREEEGERGRERGRGREEEGGRKRERGSMVDRHNRK